MIVELPMQNRTSEIEILDQHGTHYTMKVDDKIFEIDLVEVSKGIYSLITEGRSFNVEAITGDTPGKYMVNTFSQSFDVEIIDAQTRYLRSRNRGEEADSGNQIKVPMPGKVVDVLVKEGDQVTAGQTLVIVSAMKMDSEYKAGKAGAIAKVNVRPGDTVDSDQILIIME